MTLVELDDAKYAVPSTSSDGLTADSGVKESGGKFVNRLYAKVLAGDSDVLDSVVDGTTYKRVLNVSSGLVQTTSVADAAITAIKISVAQISAIAADLGTITAGLIEDAGATRGVVITGSVPGGFVRYLNLNGSGSFLKHDKLDMKYDGTATFAGLIDITTPQAALTIVPGFVIMRDPDVTHGMTDIVPTDVLGYLAETTTLSGGLSILGFSDDTTTALSLQGSQATGSTISAAVTVQGAKKTGTNRTALANTELLFEIDNSTSPALKQLGSGKLTAGWGGATLGTLQPVAMTVFRLKNVTHANVTESSITGAPWSMPASTLDVDGAAIRITVTGLTGANSGFPRIKFGGTYLDTNPAILTAHNFVWRATVVRLSGTTQVAMLERCDNGTWVLERTSPAETLSNAINVDIRSSENGGATTTYDSVIIEYLQAP